MNGLVIKNIGRLVTMEAAGGRKGRLGVIEGAALIAKDGLISWFGAGGDMPRLPGDAKVVDAKGAVVMPGLVDCHTHLVHAGSRHDEFNLRSQGKTYSEIAASGGGIMSTVRATRAASKETLVTDAMGRADEALSLGTTTMEVKTGYGLDLDSELKIADAIGELKRRRAIDIIGTFLGAHIVPQEFKGRKGEYITLVVDRMLPEMAKRDWMKACDVFVEDIAFSREDAALISERAKALGLAMHLHVDQFTDIDGGELAANIHALSADHLDRTSDAGLKAMARAGVVAVLLPGASLFAGGGHFPDARRFVEGGVRIAIATDYNPGTNPCLNLMLMATIAVTQMHLSADDALLAITANAARALGLSDRGVIGKGKRADLIVVDTPDEYYPLYRYGANLVSSVFTAARP
jgi:imidazolonepropionase